MKFFLDSVDLAEIEAASALGVVDGVTTNPGLLSQTQTPVEDLISAVEPQVTVAPPIVSAF